MADQRDTPTHEPAREAGAGDQPTAPEKAAADTRGRDPENDDAQPNHLGEAEAEFERSRGSR
jgi:hypothetical protein